MSSSIAFALEHRLPAVIGTTVAVNCSPRIDPIGKCKKAYELRQVAASAIVDQEVFSRAELTR